MRKKKVKGNSPLPKKKTQTIQSTKEIISKIYLKKLSNILAFTMDNFVDKHLSLLLYLTLNSSLKIKYSLTFLVWQQI